MESDKRDVRAALAFCGVGALFVIAFVVVGFAAQAVLLAFGGLLLGTSLRGVAEWVAVRLRWPVGWTLVACLAIAVGLGIVMLALIVPAIADQFAMLLEQLTAAYARVSKRIADSPLGQRLAGSSLGLEQPLSYLGRAAGVLASTIGWIGSAVVIAFIAVYSASAPEVYRRGVVRLVPISRRDRIDEVIDALARTLRRWMLGRIVSMTVVGVATTVGLWLLDIPLAFPLGLLAGGLGFIPNIGAIASAIPALLIAATIDLAHLGSVLALYVGVNAADGYVLTPWIEKRAVETPPALVIVSQLVFGALWGLFGLMFATPLLACGLVIVRMLYVQDVLERSRSPSAPDGGEP